MSELTTKWPEEPAGLKELLLRAHDYQDAMYELDCRLENSNRWRDYERARAEAALERLRLAVEALKEIETEARQADDDNECADETHQLAIDALSAIGDLPPVQKEG